MKSTTVQMCWLRCYFEDKINPKYVTELEDSVNQRNNSGIVQNFQLIKTWTGP